MENPHVYAGKCQDTLGPIGSRMVDRKVGGKVGRVKP